MPVVKDHDIFGDYKLTVNQVSMVDADPIPKKEEPFATLTEGQTKV